MATCAVCGKPVVTPYPTNDGTILHPNCARLRGARLRNNAWTKDKLAATFDEGESTSRSRGRKR